MWVSLWSKRCVFFSLLRRRYRRAWTCWGSSCLSIPSASSVSRFVFFTFTSRRRCFSVRVVWWCLCFRGHHVGGLAAGEEDPGHVHHRSEVAGSADCCLVEVVVQLWLSSDVSVWWMIELWQLRVCSLLLLSDQNWLTSVNIVNTDTGGSVSFRWSSWRETDRTHSDT